MAKIKPYSTDQTPAPAAIEVITKVVGWTHQGMLVEGLAGPKEWIELKTLRSGELIKIPAGVYPLDNLMLALKVTIMGRDGELP